MTPAVVTRGVVTPELVTTAAENTTSLIQSVDWLAIAPRSSSRPWP